MSHRPGGQLSLADGLVVSRENRSLERIAGSMGWLSFERLRTLESSTVRARASLRATGSF